MKEVRVTPSEKKRKGRELATMRHCQQIVKRGREEAAEGCF